MKYDIFVFGSNLSGIHGAGAALYAKKHHGAVTGIGHGIAGNSYALPTKGYNITYMHPDLIQNYVSQFLIFADKFPEVNFKVTQVGCGLAGNKASEIAAMFTDIPSNCYFDTAWKDYLPKDTNFWGTF